MPAFSSALLKRLALVGALAAPSVALAQPPAEGSGPTVNAPPAAAALPAPQPAGEQRFAVGKWPEGLVGSQGSLWVAQSGERTIAQLEPATGRTLATVKIGRLPVSMAAMADGGVLVLLGTDEVLKRVDPKSRKVKKIAKLPDHPEVAKVLGDAAFVLLWKDASSVGSSVLRVDLKTGRTVRSADLGPNAMSLTVGAGHVWVGAFNGQVTTLNAETLAIEGSTKLADRSFRVAYGAGALFVAGAQGVARLAADGGPVTQKVELAGAVQAIGAWDDVVAVATEGGQVWLLDPATLSIRSRLQTAAPFGARDLTREGDALYLTSFMEATYEKGEVLRVPLPR